MKMVDQSESTTHTPSLIETIAFQASSRSLDIAQITDLYVKKKLSTPQVAKQVGCSKSFVITTLKRLNLLRPKGVAQTDPDNYRTPLPPYGYRVVDGKLSVHPAEIKVCRMIVDLIDRQGMNRLAASKYLTQKGVRNRRGETTWHNYTVSRIYDRWKGKL